MKNPEIQKFLDDLLTEMTGETTGGEASIRMHVCVLCKQPAEEFTDVISRKEFQISGMCQECQDDIFGKD